MFFYRSGNTFLKKSDSLTYVTVIGFLKYRKHNRRQLTINLFVRGRGWSHLSCGVPGESRMAVDVKLIMTTNKHSRIGPKMAPSHPSQNMPPAIDKPVKYACPPLPMNQSINLKEISKNKEDWLNSKQKSVKLPVHIGINGWIHKAGWKKEMNQD